MRAISSNCLPGQRLWDGSRLRRRGRLYAAWHLPSTLHAAAAAAAFLLPSLCQDSKKGRSYGTGRLSPPVWFGERRVWVSFGNVYAGSDLIMHRPWG